MCEQMICFGFHSGCGCSFPPHISLRLADPLPKKRGKCYFCAVHIQDYMFEKTTSKENHSEHHYHTVRELQLKFYHLSFWGGGILFGPLRSVYTSTKVCMELHENWVPEC